MGRFTFKRKKLHIWILDRKFERLARQRLGEARVKEKATPFRERLFLGVGMEIGEKISGNTNLLKFGAIGSGGFYQLIGCFWQNSRIGHSVQLFYSTQTLAISKSAFTSSILIRFSPFLLSIYIITKIF